MTNKVKESIQQKYFTSLFEDTLPIPVATFTYRNYCYSLIDFDFTTICYIEVQYTEVDIALKAIKSLYYIGNITKHTINENDGLVAVGFIVSNSYDSINTVSYLDYKKKCEKAIDYIVYYDYSMYETQSIAMSKKTPLQYIVWTNASCFEQHEDDLISLECLNGKHREHYFFISKPSSGNVKYYISVNHSNHDNLEKHIGYINTFPCTDNLANIKYIYSFHASISTVIKEHENKCCQIIELLYNSDIEELHNKQVEQTTFLQTLPIDSYQRKAMQYDDVNIFDNNMLYGAISLSGETGEVVEIIKKIHYHKHLHLQQELILELGDVLWAINKIATDIGITIHQVEEANLQKLQQRYPEGKYNREHSNHCKDI